MPNFPQGARDITTQAQASQAAKELASVPEIAVDLEADAMHAFRARLCFLQIGTDHDIYLFDTLVPEVRLEGLAPQFADPERTKFFHAAGGDLRSLAEAGLRVAGLFDTHRAATLLGWPKVGLANLARELVGITLTKAHQQSDFSLRPMPEGMRDYIADDVRYLSEIGRQVREACRTADILEEVELDCAKLCDEAVGRPEIAEYRPKIPKTLPAKEQAFQRAAGEELHRLRLEWAQAADVPMGRMLSNAAVAELVSRPPPDLHQLKRVQGVRGPFVREHGEEVLALLKAFRERADKGNLPMPGGDSNPRDPKRRKREEQLREFRTAKALERKVTGSVVLTNSLMEKLAAEPPKSKEALGAVPYFGPKRLRLYGAELLELLNR